MKKSKSPYVVGSEVIWTKSPQHIWTVTGFGGNWGVYIEQDDWQTGGHTSVNVPFTELSLAPRCPYRCALAQIMGKPAPYWVRGDFRKLGDRVNTLQDWISSNLPDALNWSTAIGIVEAVEHLVEEALANGNIAFDADGTFRHLNG